MLTITVDDKEFFDEASSMFFTLKGGTIRLEHSLVSVSKWESKWKKSFMKCVEDETLTGEEIIDYIRCMTLTQNVREDIYRILMHDGQKTKEIMDYIIDPHTATTFSDESNSNNGEFITSELIYYWMVAFRIPFECQKWHLNRLTTLIRICSIKNQPPKKMSQQEIMARNARLNAERRAKYNSKG